MSQIVQMERIFYPGDIILFEHAERGLLRDAKQWSMESRWGHVSVFWGVVYPNGNEIPESYNLDASDSLLIPLHAEAIGRGTLKTDLLLSKGRYVKVLRHTDPVKAFAAALEAGGFSRLGECRYDYPAIVCNVVPYLVVRRLLRVNCGFGYWRNEIFICSEMADAAYNYTLFDDDRHFPTLPGDYEYAEALKVVWEGIL